MKLRIKIAKLEFDKIVFFSVFIPFLIFLLRIKNLLEKSKNDSKYVIFDWIKYFSRKIVCRNKNTTSLLHSESQIYIKKLVKKQTVNDNIF